MKRYIFLIITIPFLYLSKGHAQKKNEDYISFNQRHVLIFINDSMLAVKNIYKHMQPVYSFYTKYKNLNDTIYFQFPRAILNTDDVKRAGLGYLLDYNASLIRKDDELIDLSNRVIYVLAKKMYKKKYRGKNLLVLDGKKYINKETLTNSYGIVTKDGERSKGLKKIIKNLKKDSTYYIINRLDLFESYQKYGVLGLKGVTEYYTRNKIDIN